MQALPLHAVVLLLQQQSVKQFVRSFIQLSV